LICLPLPPRTQQQLHILPLKYSVDAAAIGEFARNAGAQEMFISSDEVLNLRESARANRSF